MLVSMLCTVVQCSDIQAYLELARLEEMEICVKLCYHDLLFQYFT